MCVYIIMSEYIYAHVSSSVLIMSVLQEYQNMEMIIQAE